jgi:hypothetical protein
MDPDNTYSPVSTIVKAIAGMDALNRMIIDDFDFVAHGKSNMSSDMEAMAKLNRKLRDVLGGYKQIIMRYVPDDDVDREEVRV